MAAVKPFRAVRYDERRAGPAATLVAPPYDVITTQERGRYFARSPYNVARLIVPETSAEAGRLFREWRAGGVLVREDEPALWWLSEEYEGPDGVRRTRRGFVATVGLEPYESGSIRPHERTYPEPKRAQLELLRAVRANLSPILLLYDDPSAAAERALEPLAGGPPAIEVAEEASTTCVWRIADPGAIAAVADALAARPLVIADGHHRYETALAFHAEDGREASRSTLAVLANTHGEGLTIFPTHRLVDELPVLNGDLRVTPVPGGPEDALRLLEGVSRSHPAFVVYRRDGAALVEAPAATGLDTTALDRLGLRPSGFTPRTADAVSLVDAGQAAAAFLLRAPTMEQVRAVAEAGQTMPQKSTYFYPKLLSGLLFHEV